MLQRYLNFVLRTATGKIVLVALAIYLVAGNGLMGWGANHINALSGKEVQVLDLCLTGYSPAEVNDYLSAYSPEARRFAVVFGAVADSFYPFVYTIFLTLLMAWVYKNRVASKPGLGYLLLLPPVILVLDFMENLHIIAMLRRYPDIPEEIIKAGSILTAAKWGMFAVVAILILGGLILKIVNRK